MSSTISPISISFGGGLNLASTSMEMQAGQCVQLFNYEINTMGRYQRMMGYERFDGQLSPSSVAPKELDGWPFISDESEAQAVSSETASRRSNILAVPGSGKVLGIFVFNGEVYAFRNNESGTEAKLYKSSIAGWEAVITPTLLPCGEFEFELTNFSGSSGAMEVIGVDGVNKAFRFNGVTFSQINGPIIPDAPTHVEALPSQILALSYKGGSLVTSAIGDPEKFSPVDGGVEFAVSDEIVSIEVQADNSCAVLCRNKTYILYGTSKEDFRLGTLSKATGAIPKSISTMANSIYVDDRGLTRLDRVQAFGNFEAATMSRIVSPLISRYSDKIVCAFSVKEKNQYRVCFSDKSGLVMTFEGNEVLGFSTFSLGFLPSCCNSFESIDGREIILAGGDDGFVYQLDKWFNFDGEPLPFVCRTAFTNLGMTEIKKRWKKMVLEVEVVGECSIAVSPDFNYSDLDIPQHRYSEEAIFGGGGYWDQAVWDETNWASASTFTADIYIDGVSKNIATVISGNAENDPPHIINGVILHYSKRGRRR